MRVAVAQMNSVTGDKERNVARASELIHQASAEGADVVVLPEFFNVEYFAQHRDYRYLDYAEPLEGPSLTEMSAAAKTARVWVVATILERKQPGFTYDTSVLFDREGIRRGVYRKTHPAAVYSLEKLYFRYGSQFPVVDVEGWPVGISICYDNFFPEVPRTLALYGAELIIAPFAAPKHPIWHELHTMRAFENGCFLVVCNKVGREDDWQFAGNSLIVSPGGEILGEASDEKDELLVRDLDRTHVRQWRERYPMFRDRRPDLYGALTMATEDL